jgi:hypothetical protein
MGRGAGRICFRKKGGISVGEWKSISQYDEMRK